jgi:hypothetical protein
MTEAGLRSRLLMTLEVEVGVPIEVGDVGAGVRRCVPVIGGRFFGDIEGEIIPGGTDWQTVCADGRREIQAQYALKTRDGAVVELSSNGLRHASPSVQARQLRGEPVTASEYYFRTCMRFRTAAPVLARFNSLLAVSDGVRLANLVRLRVFEVL